MRQVIKWPTRWLGLAAVAALAIVLVGCSSDEGPQRPAAPAPAAPAAPAGGQAPAPQQPAAPARAAPALPAPEMEAIAVPTVVVAGAHVVSIQEYFEDVQRVLELVGIAVGMLIAISCHRLVILGVDSLPSAWGLFWSGRETRFLGWMFLIAFSSGAIVLPPYFFLIEVSPNLSFDLRALSALVFTVSVFYGGYVSARLSIVLPATAIDQRPTLKGSWRLSRSNGWRLGLVVFLPSILIFVLIRLGVPLLRVLSPQTIPEQFLSSVALGLGGLLGIASVSKAFQWFTGKSEP